MAVEYSRRGPAPTARLRRAVAGLAVAVLLLAGCALVDDPPAPAEGSAAAQPATKKRSKASTRPAGTASPSPSDPTSGPPIPGGPPTATAVAHRGAVDPRSTENGLPALQNAARLGAEMVELDVRPTADGVLVALHDKSLLRTTDCVGKVWERTVADIQTSCRLDDGSAVPTLRELAQVAGRHALPLMVELKEGPGWTSAVFAGLRADLEPVVSLPGSVFLSFDDGLLARANEVVPELPGIWIVPRRLSTSRAVFSVAAEGLLVDGELTTAAWMRGARRHGKLVYSRVVDTERGWQVCAEIGMDGILTNRLADYLRWRTATP